VIALLAFLFLTYLFASIPFGLAVTTLYGGEQDIRTAGSGNIGTTNVARVYGWKLAAPTLGLDALKGFLPTLMAPLFLPQAPLLAACLTALTAFIGHCFSIFLEFRGGKGVATGAGALLAILPGPLLLAAALWAVLLTTTGRSSVAALGSTLGLIGLTTLLQPHNLPIVALMGAGVGFTHIANVRRLVRGEEKVLIRPVLLGRPPKDTPSLQDVLQQGPGGGPQTPLWREDTEEPLADNM